jgi:hypothetical protein
LRTARDWNAGIQPRRVLFTQKEAVKMTAHFHGFSAAAFGSSLS